MKLPSSEQVNAGLRHLGTASVTAATVLAALGALPQEKVQDVTDNIHKVMDGLNQVYSGLSALVVILGPVAVVLITKASVGAQSLRRQLTSITSNPNVNVEGKITVPPEVANAVPSDKVVAHGT